MKACKFTEAQKAFIINRGEEGAAVAEICRKAGISQATYFKLEKEVFWPSAFGDEAAEAACRKIGYPKTIRVDNGSEFISRYLDLWAYRRGVIRDFSRPGKPTDNAFIEAFNGRFRAECLNTHGFVSLEDARESWRIGAETTMRSDRTVRSATRFQSN